MDLIRKIPKKFTKKFGNKVINRQYFRRKTGLNSGESLELIEKSNLGELFSIQNLHPLSLVVVNAMDVPAKGVSQ